MKTYDLIVLGGGAGGLTVAAGAAGLGANVALVEKNAHLGGDCLHYGCVPSKVFIASAKKVYEAQKSTERFGLTLTGEPDIAEAMDRVKAAIAEIQEEDSDERFKDLGVDLYKGKGRFINEHQIQVGYGNVIEGKRLVVATGSRPSVPPIDGIKDIWYLTNETVFDVKETPKRLVVVGGGPMGLELAQSFARFGAEVTVLETNSTIFGKEDEDVIPVIKKSLEQELTFQFEAVAKKVREEDGTKVVTYEQHGKEIDIVADEILMATGRKPNTDEMCLDKSGVNVDDRGNIKVNEYLQSSQAHIFAIGDTNGQYPFTHAAGMEGKLVVRNALFGFKGKVSYENVPWVTYTDPEVFHLGLTEKEAKAKFGMNIKVFKVHTDKVDRFIADRDEVGFAKVVTDSKGHILGAHAIGTNAGDWMQEIIFAKAQDHKIGDISNVIHPYPTHGEILQQSADLYWREKLFDGVLPKMAEKYIQWFR
ncbi:pyruvate/2-oxoglutarate dehydrogenase complex dihydrolipoamide dehydrogenase (E3) component [Scopulibacillus darangshiensis]|uniref:Pyruvate/2-oxoglutarate dehydrogenase complex dihydrolipoamide dehydrogenase (E3) component n=1 Tax=Scopulibacillus darangshiensis TaxID=442528 RepID=A0A4R2P6Z1_9BACL|nr:FAD-dependent oxidoreductase [Scopulibacillus darangshiensis]TCP29934.1 pyruvate/2-oxoglutarate dehydrogenase complex dihydrolipoamide dehydrogenase (E3) component [Scopulibacillus darangshiensis]